MEPTRQASLAILVTAARGSFGIVRQTLRMKNGSVWTRSFVLPRWICVAVLAASAVVVLEPRLWAGWALGSLPEFVAFILGPLALAEAGRGRWTGHPVWRGLWLVSLAVVVPLLIGNVMIAIGLALHLGDLPAIGMTVALLRFAVAFPASSMSPQVLGSWGPLVVPALQWGLLAILVGSGTRHARTPAAAGIAFGAVLISGALSPGNTVCPRFSAGA